MELICLLNCSRRIILASHCFSFFILFHKLFAFEGRGKRMYSWEKRHFFPHGCLSFIILLALLWISSKPFVTTAINGTCVKGAQTSTKWHMLYSQPVTQNAHECICCLLIFCCYLHHSFEDPPEACCFAQLFIMIYKLGA